MAESSNSDSESGRSYMDTEPEMYDSDDYAYRKKARYYENEFRTTTEEEDSDSEDEEANSILNHPQGFIMAMLRQAQRDSRSQGRRESEESYPSVSMKPAFFSGAPKLKEMAYFKIAIALWNHVNIPRGVAKETGNYARNGLKWRSVRQSVMSLTDKLQIPSTIREILLDYIQMIRYKIESWIGYHFPRVFQAYTNDKHTYCHIYSLVWNLNGTIDCKQTARNLLNSGKLTDWEKYRMLCLYCLEDEMKAMSPKSIIEQSAHVIDPPSFPLFHYWDCYFRNKMNKIRVPEGLSVDRYMFENPHVDNWPAKEYFFNRLSSQEQVQSAIVLIDRTTAENVTFQKLVLMKLDDAQRHLVYMDRASQIIRNYAMADKENGRNYGVFQNQRGAFYDDIISTWSDVRNLISEDQFVSIFQTLLDRLPYVFYEQVWDMAAENFKLHFVTSNNYENIERLFESTIYFVTNTLKLITNNIGSDLKRQIVDQDFFKKYLDSKLSYSYERGKIDEILNIFFSDAQLSSRYKLNLYLNSIYIKNQCLRSYQYGSNVLDETLKENFSSYPESTKIISEYKKTLIFSPESISKCVDLIDQKDNKLNEIIAFSLPDDNTRMKFIKDLTMSSSAIAKFKKMIKNNLKDQVKSCLDRFLTSNEDKINVKRQLYPDPMKSIYKVFFKWDAAQWQAHLMWFYDDENLVQVFKQSLPLDKIFDTVLKTCVGGKPIVLDPVDRFLEWYFKTSREKQLYQMKIADAYAANKVISTLLHKKDVVSTKVVIHWLLDNDADQLAKFKANNKGKPIFNMI